MPTVEAHGLQPPARVRAQPGLKLRLQPFQLAQTQLRFNVAVTQALEHLGRLMERGLLAGHGQHLLTISLRLAPLLGQPQATPGDGQCHAGKCEPPLYRRQPEKLTWASHLEQAGRALQLRQLPWPVSLEERPRTCRPIPGGRLAE